MRMTFSLHGCTLTSLNLYRWEICLIETFLPQMFVDNSDVGDEDGKKTLKFIRCVFCVCARKFTINCCQFNDICIQV